MKETWFRVGALFGTDGVRGVANVDLTPELAVRLGRAGAQVLGSIQADQPSRPFVVVGRDTRRSGTMLEAALAAGMASAGVDVVLVGVLPTPAIAYLTRRWGALGGAVVSASHNPVDDNGIKFFSAQGFKLSEDVEEQIEALVLDEGSRGGLREAVAGRDAKVAEAGGRAYAEAGLRSPSLPAGAHVGQIRWSDKGAADYCDFLLGTVSGSFAGWKVVIDCAHGAASQVAPQVFRRLGCQVLSLHDQPDGFKINVDCGSTHPQVLQKAVVEAGARVGFAFDGDADRVIAVDEQGQVVDGDAILALCGTHWLAEGRLRGNAVAATVYSNLGLAEALAQWGGDVVTTQAGDRFVLEAMLQHGLVLGGEQSGHIIFLDYTTTGDGILSALQVMQVLAETGRPLSELAARMPRFPQVLENVPVPGSHEQRRLLVASEAVQAAIARAQAMLAPRGRVFVRPSGTEPLVRVLGEGREAVRVRKAVEEVVAALKAATSGEAPGLSPSV